MAEFLLVLMRWLHITSVATLIGGLIYARMVIAPTPGGADFQARAVERFRPLVYAAITALVISGLYNILTSPGHTLRYHILLGIKLLAAAHVFAVAILLAGKKVANPTRAMGGCVISGLVIIAISAYLRRIF